MKSEGFTRVSCTPNTMGFATFMLASFLFQGSRYITPSRYRASEALQAKQSRDNALTGAGLGAGLRVRSWRSYATVYREELGVFRGRFEEASL